MKQMTMKRLMSVWENISVVLSDGMWLVRIVMQSLLISINVHKKNLHFFWQALKNNLRFNYSRLIPQPTNRVVEVDTGFPASISSMAILAC